MPKHNLKSQGPSNARYKAENRLKKNKIRRIMKNQKIDEVEAEIIWEKSKKK